MCLHDGGRTNIVSIGPEGRAGSGAAGAQDALGGVVEPLAVLDALVAFPAGGRRIVVDKVRFDGAIAGEERFHVHYQVLKHRQAADRFDLHLLAQVLHQHLAGQPVAAVDDHRIGATDAVGAGTAQGQRPVLVPLDRVQRVQKLIVGVYINLVFAPPGLGVLLGVETLDLQCYIHELPPGEADGDQ